MTVTAQLAAGASSVRHDVGALSLNHVGADPPRAMVTGADPVLVSVNVLAMPSWPTYWVPKSQLVTSLVTEVVTADAGIATDAAVTASAAATRMGTVRTMPPEVSARCERPGTIHGQL